METKLLLVILLINLIHHNSSDEKFMVEKENVANEKVLSRQKRYLVFPTGSSFSVAVCMTVGIYGNPQYSMFR
jgi:hypothetical protein